MDAIARDTYRPIQTLDVSARQATSTQAAPTPKTQIHAAAAADPRVAPVLREYLSTAPADESTPPPGFEFLAYGSTPVNQMPLATEGNDKIYIVGALDMPPVVKELAAGGVGNFASPDWLQLVAVAAERNGGLGNSEDGFLAYSRDHGFVRLRHPTFTAEQNRRLAAISLQTGWPIERLPTRQAHDNVFTDPKADAWVNDFIERSEAGIGAFMRDPSEGLTIKSGSRNRYVMKLDQESGMVVSYEYRKKGGFSGFVAKHMKYIGPAIDVLSAVATPFVGPAAAAAGQALKTGLNYAATGALRVKDAVMAAAGALATGFSNTFGFLARPGWSGSLAVAGEYADTGRVLAGTLVGAYGPSVIRDLPGGPLVDRAAQNLAVTVARGAEGARLGWADVAAVLDPLVFGVGRDPAQGLQRLGGAIEAGAVAPAEVAAALEPLIDSLTSDAGVRDSLRQGLHTAAGWLDRGEVQATELFGALLPYLIDQARRSEWVQRNLPSEARAHVRVA